MRHVVGPCDCAALSEDKQHRRSGTLPTCGGQCPATTPMCFQLRGKTPAKEEGESKAGPDADAADGGAAALAAIVLPLCLWACCFGIGVNPLPRPRSAPDPDFFAGIEASAAETSGAVMAGGVFLFGAASSTSAGDAGPCVCGGPAALRAVLARSAVSQAVAWRCRRGGTPELRRSDCLDSSRGGCDVRVPSAPAVWLLSVGAFRQRRGSSKRLACTARRSCARCQVAAAWHASAGGGGALERGSAVACIVDISRCRTSYKIACLGVAGILGNSLGRAPFRPERNTS